ncbi:low molecular weight phosphatase family protein [Lutibacter citreus]|uniref:hypothetical protein n=1 Tax=Lutibacter citreus TaxID=2138210 RepID=UPI000DBE6E62|nr:hypothetical protein [Lutibacter citreus]
MIKTVATITEIFFNNSLNELIIDKNRSKLLYEIADYIVKLLKSNTPVNLNFLCANNNCRSQLSQVWATYAVNFYQLKNLKNYSGGTTPTSFNRNTAKTLKKVGFNFQILKLSHHNPHYSITYNGYIEPIIGFSKIYDNEHNKTPFITITHCEKTKENCSYISEKAEGFHLPYEDPNNKPETFFKLNKQIAGEIHFIFKIVKENV